MKRNKIKIIELKNEKGKPVEMLDYNRPVNRSLVNKLKESMEKYGVLSSITVYDGGDKYMVVDGQHRWTAASELDLVMPAIVIGWDAMSAIVEMNTIQTNWTMANFVDFFSAHTDPVVAKNYNLLKQKKQECSSELTYSSLAKIYGKPYGGSSFKKGKWRITDEARGDQFVKQLSDLVEFLPYARSARFIYAYTDVAYHEDYDHQRMMKKFNQNHGVSLITSSNPTNYGKMLTKVYNFHQSKNLVMFKASWI
tara:strand:+ start:1590 stop:2345 length:756 start_codon:yes stop_codon:yes gene_type:complete